MIEATGTNTLTLDTGANAIVNTGTLAATGAGGLVVDSTLVGGGSATVGAGSSIELAAGADSAVSFESAVSGTLKLDQSALFTGTIAGFGGADQIDLGDIGIGANATLGYTANADNSGGTLTVSDGTNTASLALLGQYTAAAFATASDGHGGTLVTSAQQTQPNQLASAHS